MLRELERTVTTDIEEVRTAEAFNALAHEWDDLLARGGESNVLFLTHAWLSAWWRHLGRPRGCVQQVELYVLVMRRSGRLCAALPLVIEHERRFRLVTRVVRFLGHELSDYQDVIVDVEEDATMCLSTLVGRLREHAGMWDVLELRETSGRSPHIDTLRRALVTAALVVDVHPDSACAAVDVHGSWREYYEARFDGRRRKDHRREWRVLAAQGPFDVEFVTSLTERPTLLEEIAEVQRSHPAAGERGMGILNTAAYAGFFRDWLPYAAAHDQLVIATFRSNGCLIAYWIVLRHDARAYLYSTAYRRGQQYASAGRLLMLTMLERFWADGYGDIDYLRGSESYKRTWCTRTRLNRRIVAGRRTLSSQLRIRMWFDTIPRLERVVHWLRGFA